MKNPTTETQRDVAATQKQKRTTEVRRHGKYCLHFVSVSPCLRGESWFLCLLAVLIFSGCHRMPAGTGEALAPKAFGTQLVAVSGEKQVAGVGEDLPQPVVVQVNGADGNPVAGALVTFHGTGLTFRPAQVLSDSSGQVSVVVQLGAAPGSDYQVIAETMKPDHSVATLTVKGENALGYEQKLGREVNEKYCIRCHDSESTPERVSNFDNLAPTQPHAFSDGTFLNSWKDADLISITARGGPALGKSASMPPYGSTLTDAQIKAITAYIRAIADPPYQSAGVKFEK